MFEPMSSPLKSPQLYIYIYKQFQTQTLNDDPTPLQEIVAQLPPDSLSKLATPQFRLWKCLSIQPPSRHSIATVIYEPSNTKSYQIIVIWMQGFWVLARMTAASPQHGTFAETTPDATPVPLGWPNGNQVS